MTTKESSDMGVELTPEVLDGIEARAKEATPGPWEYVPTSGNSICAHDGDGYWSDVADRIEAQGDAEHIAGLDPDIVLSLVAAARERLPPVRPAEGEAMSKPRVTASHYTPKDQIMCGHTTPEVELTVSFDLHDHEAALKALTRAYEDVWGQIADTDPKRP